MKVTVKETIWREYTIEEFDETMIREELPEALKREGVGGMYSWLEPFTTNQELNLETSTEIEPNFCQEGYSTVTIEDDEGNIIWENGK